MKRVILTAVILLVLGSTASAHAAPKLKRADAVDATTHVLNKRFWDLLDYQEPGFRPVRCPHRVTRYRLKCRFGFRGGDVVYVGRGQAWTAGRWSVRVKARVRRIDEYCLFVLEKPRRKCVKRYRVHGTW